jgi:hypothetical protein
VSAPGDPPGSSAGDPPTGQPANPSTEQTADPSTGQIVDGTVDRALARAVDAAVDRASGQDRTLDRIELLITALVQAAPAADLAVSDELVDCLHRIGSPLARQIARVVELIAEQLIAPGIALPPLAMACATLADGVRGRLTDRALEAARYEIETLMPVPDRPPAIAAPDVPVSALRKRGR